MGLDMYLERKSKNEFDTADAWEEVIYWRKANQIREWFATHLTKGVENCKRSEVTKEDLERLLKSCEMVLADHSKAEELLPTQGGFFFGSTDYDEWYFEQLEYTVPKLKEAIKETDWDNEDVTYYEWW